MSGRRVDIRTTRKARPSTDLESLTTNAASHNSRSKPADAKEPHSRQRNTTRKTISSKAQQKKVGLSLVEGHENAGKSRRRRADASDYIRRRFLYDDKGDEKVPRTKSSKNQKRLANQDLRVRASPLALMAASSANLQKKRKKFRDRSPTSLQSVRGPRGRKPKFPMPYPQDDEDSVDHGSYGSDNGRLSDVEDDDLEGFNDRQSKLEHDENVQSFGPFSRKSTKRPHPRYEEEIATDSLQDPDYSHEVSDYYFDSMSDFTRSRGPVALTKRGRHRIAPRLSPTRGDFIRHTSFSGREVTEFSMTDDSFNHVRGDYSIGHEASVNESSKYSPGEWGGHVESVGTSVNTVKPQAIEVDEFGGELVPQVSVSGSGPPASGSSRRKSPIRPMQVLRNEGALYQTENGVVTGVGATLIQQAQMHPPYSQSSGVDNTTPGLVDLCAAAGLDSTVSNPTNSSADRAESGGSRPQQVIANATQYSLINPNLVSLQPGGRVFLEASTRTPITAYAVAPTNSRISLVPGRFSFTHTQPTSRINQTSAGASTKTTSVVSGSANASTSNSTTRRRPTILKRGLAPATPNSAVPVVPPPKPSPMFSSPRFSPPFMRSALRNVQASSLQQSIRPVTYTLLSPAMAGQANVIAVAPNSSGTNSASQTASSRLFGAKRSAGTASETTAVSSLTPPSNSTGVLNREIGRVKTEVSNVDVTATELIGPDFIVSPSDRNAATDAGSEAGNQNHLQDSPNLNV